MTAAQARGPEMTNDADTVLRMERTFDAPVDLVFRAFTEPEQIVRWWGPEGFHIPESEFTVEVGGGFRTCMRGPESDHWVQGKYTELIVNERLAFTWAWEADGEPGPATRVTIDFEARGGQTVIQLVHEGFAEIEGRDAHGDGWASSFNCLDQVLAGLEAG